MTNGAKAYLHQDGIYMLIEGILIVSLGTNTHRYLSRYFQGLVELLEPEKEETNSDKDALLLSMPRGHQKSIALND